MTKLELIQRTAHNTNLTQVEVRKALEEILEGITISLVNGEKVEFRNFGIFKVKLRKAKMGKNPKTGKTIPIKARRTAIFKPGKGLNNRMREKI